MDRILLVEDEKMIRYGVYVMIENSGVPFREIRECRNGKDAVEQLKKDRFSLVLTDIRMPFMDGIELSKWICENVDEEERPVIVAISGYAEFEYVKSMLRYEAADYLLKPVDREELKAVLWKVETIYRKKGMVSDFEDTSEVCALTEVSRRKIEQAIDYIRRNYEKPLDMSEVSNQVSMNYSMFSAAFKEYTGVNFSSYVKKLRLDKSKKLLQNTDLNIREIASQVGFEDARRFAKIFKEETGMTPTLFREKE